MDDRLGEIGRLYRELIGVVGRLEALSPQRRFTLDGHLVGSIGESMAGEMYDLELLPASSERHDAKTVDGKHVQIKATQGKSVGLYSEPQHLLVLRILPDGTLDEVYNGPGAAAWSVAGKVQKNGQRSASLSKLRALMASVSSDSRLRRVK